ncbi:unnamed protein product [Allacma fusca]|uniref:C2H2-type domain-containing protein n=1 Tax=Allacma fusca TaxID=39272 RepID=A0A8J2PVF9_9HEXA|nr:unnamed protein product [Allacma fusca]
MNTSTSNGFSCRFNGGCGSQFRSEAEYLRHVIKHLRIRGTTCTEIVEGFREQSKSLTQDLFAFDCLIPQRILTAYNSLKAKSNSKPLQQSLDSNYPYGSISQPLGGGNPFQENPATFPVYEMVLHRFQSQEDDLIPSSSSLVSMYDVLPFVNPNTEQGNVFPTNCESNSKLRSVNWNEILENYPSAVDEMSPDQIADTVMEEKYESQKPSSIFSQCSKDSSVSSTNVEMISSDDSVTSDYEGRKRFYGIGRDYVPLTSNGSNFKSIQWPTTLALCETPSFLYSTGDFNGSGHKTFPKSDFTPHKLPAKVVVPATRKRTNPNDFRIPRSRKAQRKETTNREYYSSAYILEEGLKKKRAPGVLQVKPYICPVPKCGKSYKNANGIKYHAKYGHSAPQEFPCHCGKLYNTMHSLLAHKKTHNPIHSSDSSAEDSFNSSSDSSESDLTLSESSNSGDSEEDSCTCTD